MLRGHATNPAGVVVISETVAAVNDYDVRLAKVRGEFVRHQHGET